MLGCGRWYGLASLPPVFNGIIVHDLRCAHVCVQEVGTKQLGGVEIACLEMGEVPKDRVRAPFLAVGDWNGNVKVLGLSPENLLEQVGLFSAL